MRSACSPAFLIQVPGPARLPWRPLPGRADRLGVSVSTIRRLIADGKLTGYRLGNRILLVNPGEDDQTLQATTAWARPAKRGGRQLAWAG